MATVPSLLGRELLVVDQKTKVFELRNQYRIFDPDGEVAGSIEQVGQSWLTLLVRIWSDLDVALPVKLEVRDKDGTPLLTLTKPWFRMTLTIARPDGAPVGSIRKKIRVGKARFLLLDPAGTEVGVVNAQNWRAKDFKITDLDHQPVADVNKKWKGLATELFTDADRYAIRLDTTAREPLRSLALSAALAIDLVMKQKDYG